MANEQQPSSPNISWPLNRPEQRTPWDPAFTPANGHAQSAAPAPAYPPNVPAAVPSILPSGRYPLSGISLRAFALGLAQGVSAMMTIYLAFAVETPLWRAPFFVYALSMFHFLEFLVTASYNAAMATPAAFLLSRNGYAYNAAHTLALIETTLGHTYLPGLTTWIPPWMGSWILGLGLFMIAIGQATRSVAMAHAGKNFNHTVQQYRAYGHNLVTTGIYGTLRHPSYFGFFWWGLGSQLVLGNSLCFTGFAIILWRFFSKRIDREEELLMKFFGSEYADYRRKTTVGIPFIQ